MKFHFITRGDWTITPGSGAETSYAKHPRDQRQAPPAVASWDADLIERHLASRQNADRVDLVARQLRFRVEITQALDLVVEKIDSQRFVRTHREHVEQRATHGELSVLVHLGDPQVAAGIQ